MFLGTKHTLRESAYDDSIGVYSCIDLFCDEFMDQLDGLEHSWLILGSIPVTETFDVVPARHPHPSIDRDWDVGRMRQDVLDISVNLYPRNTLTF
jgi:hypothetical protein